MEIFVLFIIIRKDEKNKLREEEENNLPQMKKLFFLYVWLNLTRILTVFENLVKHIRFC